MGVYKITFKWVKSGCISVFFPKSEGLFYIKFY